MVYPPKPPVPVSPNLGSIWIVTAEKTASPENEDYDLLLVVDGEVTDFKTDPVTGLRSLTLPSGT